MDNHSKIFLLFEFFVLKSHGVRVVGGLQHLSVSPRPFELIRNWLGLGLRGVGTKGSGPGLENIFSSHKLMPVLQVNKWWTLRLHKEVNV